MMISSFDTMILKVLIEVSYMAIANNSMATANQPIHVTPKIKLTILAPYSPKLKCRIMYVDNRDRLPINVVAIHIKVKTNVEIPNAISACLRPRLSAISEPKNNVETDNPVLAIMKPTTQPDTKSFGCTFVVVY